MKIFKVLKAASTGILSWILLAQAVGLGVFKWLHSMGQAGVTYTADNYTVPMPAFPGVGVQLVREFLFTVSTALALNDLIQLCRIPGSGTPIVITDWFLDIGDLDAGGTPVIQIQLGDGTTATKFHPAIVAGVVAQKLSSLTSTATAAAVPASFSTNGNLTITVSTGPQTGATGVFIRGRMNYHFVGASTPV